MRALALGLVFCGLGLASGCRTPLPETRLGEGDPRPQQLLENLGAGREAVPALRARARVAIDAPDLKLSRPQRLAVARPGRLRVEVLGLFGQLAAVLVADRGRYQLYERGSRRSRRAGCRPPFCGAWLEWIWSQAKRLICCWAVPVPGRACELLARGGWATAALLRPGGWRRPAARALCV